MEAAEAQNRVVEPQKKKIAVEGKVKRYERVETDLVIFCRNSELST
jgi:hypothetical protein